MATLYDIYVKLPDDWKKELTGFIENYSFPCVGVWDGFHVYVETKLKSYYSFKKRYSMSTMGLVGYNKRFLNAPVGAPGSTHDARLLRNAPLFSEIVNGQTGPQCTFDLGDLGEIPLLTKGRWRILCRLNNLKYIIMACITLHNFCIETKDPCKPRWILEVKELDLHEKETVKEENKNKADLVRNRISNWLWSRKL